MKNIVKLTGLVAALTSVQLSANAQDVEPIVKREALRKTVVTIGPVWHNNLAEEQESTGYGFGAGHYWEVAPVADIGLVGNLAYFSDTKAYKADMGIGMRIIPVKLQVDISPYIFGEFGFAVTGCDNCDTDGRARNEEGGYENKVGFGYALGTGLDFFRTSTVHLSLAYRFSGTLYEHTNEKNPQTHSAMVSLFIH